MEKQMMCPSAPAEEGAQFLGVIRHDGSVAYVKDRLEVTREFVALTCTGRPPEQRFRFASLCQESACAQWVDDRCGLPEQLGGLLTSADVGEPLPRCSIRARCRWFHQEGADACRICPSVTTRGETDHYSGTGQDASHGATHNGEERFHGE